MKIGILASGAGGNATAIMERAAAGVLHVEVAAVLSNKETAPVLARARERGVPGIFVDPRSHPGRASYERELAAILKDHGCEIIVLAGYMLVLGGAFLKEFPNRALNIHPAILPSFPGAHGAADALKHGVKLTGASVHFVEEEVDSGALIIQGAIPVSAGEELDALKQRIHAVEHRIYPQAIEWLAQGRLSVSGRTVFLASGQQPLARPESHCLIWPPLEQGF